ncbi:unnamed protein product [Ceutorhynchus assimilis]|uniref:SEA domain-containing protein n=1 Tax=Ceutorhynchus assimilis TaxID=467358 RepID=A0A9N9MN20_9CUCU|nr:unnamed protein product [Ceutorhynchus assimilis]
MVVFGTLFLTVLLAVAQLGNGATLNRVSSDTAEHLNAAGAAAVQNEQNTQTITKVETTETKNTGIVAGALEQSSHTSQDAEIDSDSDEQDVAYNVFVPPRNNDDNTQDFWRQIVDLGSNHENLNRESDDLLFNQIVGLAQSRYGVTSGHLGLLKDIIHATYVVMRNFVSNIFGSNGLFEQYVRETHRLVSRFWSAVLGNPGLLTGFIHSTRWVWLQLLTSVLGGSGLLNYAVDRTYRVEADHVKSVYGPYKQWPSGHFDQHSNGWLHGVDRYPRRVDYSTDLYDVDHSHLNSYGDQPNTHGENLNTHGDNLNTHGDNLNTHGEILNTHGDNLNTHGDSLNTHGDNLNTHGDNLNTHADNLNTHGHHLNSYGNHPNSHSDYLVAQSGDQSLNLEQNRNRWSENKQENSASGTFSVHNEKESSEGESASSSLYKEAASEIELLLKT